MDRCTQKSASGRRMAGGWMLLGLIFIPFVTFSQLHIGIITAPAVQSLTIQEATITDGFKPRLLPQAGVMATLGLGKGFFLRGGARFEVLGYKIELHPILDHAYQHYYGVSGLEMWKFSLGGGYAVPISEWLALLGTVETVIGLPYRSHYKDVEDGKVVEVYQTSISSYKTYLGLDIGLALQYELEKGIRFRFAPTLQTQLNKAINSDIFIYKFVGFAPRLEVSFPLTKKP